MSTLAKHVLQKVNKDHEAWPIWALQAHREQRVATGTDTVADWLTGLHPALYDMQSACQRRH